MKGYKKSYSQSEESYLKELVLSVIPEVANGTSSTQIAEVTGLNARDVRYLIQKLRDNGCPICATPAKGYWLARYSYELDETLAKLKSHIKNCTETYNALIRSQMKLKQKEYRDDND